MPTTIQSGFAIPLASQRGGTGRSAVNPWDGKIVGAAGDGNPITLLQAAHLADVASASPTNITTALARICYFRLPADLTVNKIRYYGISITSGVFFTAIYNADTLARLTAELGADTGTQTWGAAGSGLNLPLVANQLYFIALSVKSTGAQVAFLGFTNTAQGTRNRIAILPKSWPGSLDADAGFVPTFGFGQFAVTVGALPNPANTIAVQSDPSTGSFPAFFLDNDNS